MTQDSKGKPVFGDLGISQNFLASLTKAGFIHPTPIQHQVIPVALTGKDVVGIAQTGTGKTLGFGIPIIQNLAVNKGQGLILCPTRELALQVDDELSKIGKSLGLRTAVLIGGESQHKQVKRLRARPHVVVATPGRLVDLMDQRIYKLDRVKAIVLDEADRMLDVGFLPQIRRVLDGITPDRQTMLFSATMPEAIAEIAKKYMKTPLRVEVARAGTASKNVEQEMIIVDQKKKIGVLKEILDTTKGKVLVFSRTKHGAKRIARDIRGMRHTATEIHGNRSLPQRKKALAGFKSGQFRVMVATDIAARGIDVKEISLVINYDLPDNSEDYVHRIGRTGRADHVGKAISFASPEQGFDIRAIERLIQKELPKERRSNKAITYTKLKKGRGGRGGGRSRPRGPRGGNGRSGGGSRGRGGQRSGRSNAGRRPAKRGGKRHS